MPTEVFSIPLQKKAAFVILVHNHPSGNLRSSDADIDITDRLYQVGKMMHTEVIDHLIVSERGWRSARVMVKEGDPIERIVRLNWSFSRSERNQKDKR